MRFSASCGYQVVSEMSEECSVSVNVDGLEYDYNISNVFCFAFWFNKLISMV